MSIEWALRADVLAWLRADPALRALLQSVHDGRPAALSALPALVMEETLSVDWSVKDRGGREARLAFALEGQRGDGDRLGSMATALDRRLAGLSALGEGYRLVGVSFLRARLAKGADGRPSLFVEYRARIMEHGKDTGDGG